MKLLRESVDTLMRDLAACNVIAKAYGPPLKVDVRAIRETTGISQEQFALEFGLELATLRNWKQGRSEPDTPHAISSLRSLAIQML